ncbi:MAG: acyltransferase family protein [Pseudomonadota bacterium]
MNAPARLAHLDWIRAGAMLLGIPYHAGLIYSPGQAWFVASPEGSVLIGVITGLLGSFRMALFFWVAGLLTALVLAKRAPGRWLRGRLLRLGVPLVAAMLIISPLVMAAIAYGIATESGGAVTFEAALDDLLSRPGAHWIGHLWFLQTLLVFSVIAVVALPQIERLGTALSATTAGGIGLRHVLILGLAIGAYRLGVNGGWYLLTLHHPPGPVVAMLKIEPVLDYLPYFLLGMAMRVVPLPRLEADPRAWVALGLAAAVYVPIWQEPALEAKVLRYGAAGVLSVLGGAMIVTAASRLARSSPGWVDALVASSFTVYLVHYPIVVWAGTLLREVALPPLFEYTACIAVGVAGALAVHRLVAMSPTLTLLLNGLPFGARATVQARHAVVHHRSPGKEAEP